MKCDCGERMTEAEIKKSKDIAKRSKTPLVYMCEDCWHNYCEHAITGN